MLAIVYSHATFKSSISILYDTEYITEYKTIAEIDRIEWERIPNINNT